MNSETQAKIKENLIKERDQIKKELAGFTSEGDVPGDYNAHYPEHEKDAESNAMAFQEMDRLKAVEHRLEHRLTEINEALERIDKDEYGVCKTCQLTIEPERVQAVPTAVQCTTCAFKRDN
ncbi:MAG: hypothetical protein COV31_02705 [Candidatus Yanofskybacteria bacterium CG10_big_fil_rev_8_21_14_0_10_46_23]|uniref:Zinc finger DksA/TraR C4-type domain-containing protein n=1 Tax=Candidatus Yanofskybacteria bacterium CG10_big_fil_rev_8_21_14_0_10_46_23 TaxID=1975098 RepID=A0A2H0R445_9BACT|nr:MAG: hypothetical protein COV31_02705 [Candidatus Yanofskybacteria bacterium CG10_big_fil_rev_8_21_14_0_10_46_23]